MNKKDKDIINETIGDTMTELTTEQKLKSKIPYKWRLGNLIKSSKSQTGYYATCLAYIDARDAMDLLDRAVGFGNWKDEYKFENSQWLCGLSIRIKDDWVIRWDTGTAGNFEAEKSVISDAFKRAAVKWGVGRFLYDLKTELVEVKTYEKGGKAKMKYAVHQMTAKRVYDLTEYINNKQKKVKK